PDGPLERWIAAQPPWSDFPFVLLSLRAPLPQRSSREVARLAELGNVAVLERPLHPLTLVSAVRAAMRARRRQREAEAFLAERERQSTALRESEARFRAIAEGMPQPIWSARADGMHDYFNTRWQEVTGVTPPVGGTGDGPAWMPWAGLLHPEDRDAAEQAWRQVLDFGGAFRTEFRLRTAAGGYRWYLGRALPVRDELSGTIVRWFGSCTDIDDAVNARETLARSREELERLVDERTVSLQREMLEREKAEAALAQAQKMEAVGQLTGGVAHDFNNLLTAVLASLEMISSRSTDERVLRFAANAQRAAERGARLTQQLLAFSRRQRLRPESVDMNGLIRGMNELVTRAIGASVQFESRLSDDLPPAYVDPTQLELVLLNLAINARDAMPSGGRLTVETFALQAPPDDLADELPPGSYVAMAVSDTGTGMPPEVQARAFEPFFTTKEMGKGTGLGLSQVYGFVRQSGGTVRLRSTVGQGTRVSIYLPEAAALPEIRQEHPPAERPAATGRATILVADDDENVRELAVAMLEELGYRVIAAEDGEVALRLIQRGEPFDLLVADVVMPGLSGVEVVQRARKAGRQLRVLFATGYADLAVYREGLEGEDMIRKPYRMTELAERVERALAVYPAHGPSGAVN
ncbi:MAG TPA: ATP-binding protein, partial [Acetobacteraceae bacterium]|nr:ATP-binding protein [Acetobacteraceae bacterium]